MSADGSVLFGAVRVPPSNLQAEQALLGAILANNKAYTAVSGFLRPEMFADPIHQRIFQAIARRIDAGQIADAVTLKVEFENSGVLGEVGGTKYLTDLLSAMVGIINAADYGRVIHDTWLRRRLIEVAEFYAARAYGDLGNGEDAQQQIGLLLDEVTALEAAAAPAGDVRARGNTTAYDAFLAAVERAEGISRGEIARPYSTGLPAVDRMLGGGIGPDALAYMVGAGGAGKTELALQIAEAVAESAYEEWVAGGQDGPCPGVLYIMLGNMTARQLGARTAARYAEMRLAPIRRGTLDMEQGIRLMDAGKAVVRLPLEISDTGPATMARVLGDMRRFAKRRPLVLTIVDNFSDILSMSPDKMFGTAVAATQALKQGATTTGGTVLLLMHINSSVESNRQRSPRPRPSDIPWGTKKDADFAFGVWRPVKYLDPEPPTLGVKKMTAEGKELEAKWRQEWADKREPWPVGIADITEVIPMKLREEEDGNPDAIGKLRFDRSRHRFIDVDAEAKPEAGLWEDEV